MGKVNKTQLSEDVFNKIKKIIRSFFKEKYHITGRRFDFDYKKDSFYDIYEIRVWDRKISSSLSHDEKFISYGSMGYGQIASVSYRPRDSCLLIDPGSVITRYLTNIEEIKKGANIPQETINL